jgi:hypothetical protein
VNATAIPTTHRPATPLTRRLLMLVLATLTVLSVLNLAPKAAHAFAPGAPRVLGPIGWDGQALVAWSQPNPGNKPATSYKVERYLGDAAQPQKTYVVGGKVMSLVDKGLTNNTVYRYRVQAFNQDGASGWSAKEPVQAKPFEDDLDPFDGEPAAYVKRQYQDLLGRAPSPQELQAGITMLDTKLGGDLTNLLSHNPQRMGERFPVIRLYFAFFLRSPDVDGSKFWIAKRKAGTNLNSIASTFAGSNEFQTKYGNLSNQDFVQQVYVNVFERQPDADGLAYWTNQLDTHKKSRGQVMVGFSESNEYAGNGEGSLGKSTGRVEASDVWLAIMKEKPSNEALATYYASHIQHGGTQGTLAMLLMPTNGYPKFG